MILVLFPSGPLSALRLWIFVEVWELLNTYIVAFQAFICSSVDIWYHLCSRCCTKCQGGYKGIAEILAYKASALPGVDKGWRMLFIHSWSYLSYSITCLCDWSSLPYSTSRVCKIMLRLYSCGLTTDSLQHNFWTLQWWRSDTHSIEIVVLNSDLFLGQQSVIQCSQGARQFPVSHMRTRVNNPYSTVWLIYHVQHIRCIKSIFN